MLRAVAILGLAVAVAPPPPPPKPPAATELLKAEQPTPAQRVMPGLF